MTDKEIDETLDDDEVDSETVRPSQDEERRKRDAAYCAYKKAAVTPEYEEQLRKAGALFAGSHKFEVGDLVQVKPMMQFYRYPAENCPAIVVDPPDKMDRPCPAAELRFSDPPVDDQYQDLFVGVLDEENMFVVYKVSSRRMERWRPHQQDASEES